MNNALLLLSLILTVSASANDVSLNDRATRSQSQIDGNGDAVVTVGLLEPHRVPFAILVQAQQIASKIYAGIGVKLNWSDDVNTAIWIDVLQNSPSNVSPGVLGYAQPYMQTGTKIHIVMDRVLGTGSQRYGAALLGHVIALELAHVLERLDRHSESGLLKARWSTADIDAMISRPLSFDAEDAALVRAGIIRLKSYSLSNLTD